MRQCDKWLAGSAAIAVLLLTGCDQKRESEYAPSADMVVDTTQRAEGGTVADAASSVSESGSAGSDVEALPADLPQLAYDYDFAWRLPAAEVGSLQRRHASLCEQQGPASCRIIGMSRSGAEEDRVRGVLELAVAAKQSRALGALLEDEADDAGAELVSSQIASEELSKQIVDTEARLRTREKLRDRLEGVLDTRRGSVEELVQAERSVAQVNEEIDQARSWLAQTKGRVTFSRMTITYETGTPIVRDFLAPVTGAFGSVGTIMGWVIAILVVLGAIIGPIAGMVWAGGRLNRRFARPATEG